LEDQYLTEPLIVSYILDSCLCNFLNHRDHLDYQAVAERGAPIGTGAVESECSQFQDRFKRAGKFWTRPGLRNLLALGVI
jgi:hypothetical protein